MIIIILFYLVLILADNEELEMLKDGKTTSTTEQTQYTTFNIPDEIWIASALKDIAYYLRNHKFNEWDRRYHNEKPKESLLGFYRAFPIPSLSSFHWKVYENCYKDFYKCIIYLRSTIDTAPLTRKDDTITILNEKIDTVNESSIFDVDIECKKALEISETNGLPFDDPLEKFQWRTTASYYMCWYTMVRTPVLSMLSESCDNFANCFNVEFGNHNYDARANDEDAFGCARYSFCPDPCCPIKHLNSYRECYEKEVNPCFFTKFDVGIDPLNKTCYMDHKENQNFDDMIENKWNVSCNCKKKGFYWHTKYGLCVDINECVEEKDNCDNETEYCLNLPGTFQCVCKVGYEFDNNLQICRKFKFFSKNIANTVKENSFSNKLKDIFFNFGFKNWLNTIGMS